MSALAFLLDENIPAFLAGELLRLEPSMEILQIGDTSAPQKGTRDSEILVFAEENRKTLVTMDKQSMPGYLARHFTAGRHTWGVVFLKQGYATMKYAEDLVLMWSASDLQELQDWSRYLPY